MFNLHIIIYYTPAFSTIQYLYELILVKPVGFPLSHLVDWKDPIPTWTPSTTKGPPVSPLQPPTIPGESQIYHVTL